MLLAENIVHFTRVLRRAGLGVGTDRMLTAVAAVQAVGLARRDDVHAALAAVILERHEQQAVFDAAFEAFWRDPKLLEQLLHALLPKISGRGEKPRAPRNNRLAEALAATRQPPPAPPAGPQTAPEEIRFDAQFTHSERERLQHADFETMTADEYAQALRLARELPPPVAPVRLRRHAPAPRGRIDLRRTLQRMARDPDLPEPARTQARRALPPIVILIDISGSMERYARLFLHYAHALTRQQPATVHTFTFGTRLTPITRCLRHRDPDAALQLADAQVSDWKGGTRIASALRAFNRDWARRLLGANAAVLLVSDGLDHDDGGELGRAAALLRRQAHQFVWLNPLLRYEGFEPRAAGVRALLPHVDRFLPMHNLDSLAALARELRAPALRPSP
ncbi:MAG: VWA domain-containing protein [Burkholderiales bacterium]|nr:VWA domain-containing protein [Burkholderiales bacterium]